MISVIICIFEAFEYSLPAGSSAAMIAGCSVADWQNGFVLNPALVWECPRAGVSAAWSRPYNLVGVTSSRIVAAINTGSWALAMGYGQTSCGRYQESDIQSTLAAEPISSLQVGLGMHTLIQITGMGEADVAPVFDAGVCGKYNRFRIGAALMRINEPELNNGDIVPLRFTAGVACRPAETFVLAADVIRESAIESFGLGIEFKLIPQLTLRSGLGTNPLRYAGGLDATIGPLALNYAYQFHPQLKESHLLELRLAWL